MKKIVATLCTTTLLAAAWFVLALAPAPISGAAAECGSVAGTDADGKPTSTPIKTSILECETGSNESISSMVLVFVNYLAMGAGIAVVGGLAWGGFIYASAGGDSGKVKEAKNIIINSIIGLVTFFLMYAAANFLVPGGLFS